MRYNNLKQTHLIVKFLSELNFAVVDIDDERKAVDVLNENQIDYLAKREHNAWYLRKVSEENLTEDDLLKEVNDEDSRIKPWDDLYVDLKEANLHTFEVLPETLKDAGLKIIKV